MRHQLQMQIAPSTNMQPLQKCQTAMTTDTVPASSAGALANSSARRLAFESWPNAPSAMTMLVNRKTIEAILRAMQMSPDHIPASGTGADNLHGSHGRNQAPYPKLSMKSHLLANGLRLVDLAGVQDGRPRVYKRADSAVRLWTTLRNSQSPPCSAE